jgi:hypothetical protein
LRPTPVCGIDAQPQRAAAPAWPCWRPAPRMRRSRPRAPEPKSKRARSRSNRSARISNSRSIPARPVHIDNPLRRRVPALRRLRASSRVCTATLQQPADRRRMIRVGTRGVRRPLRDRAAPARGSTRWSAGQRFDLVAYVPQQHAVTARTLDGRHREPRRAVRSRICGLGQRRRGGARQRGPGPGSRPAPAAIEARIRGVWRLAGSRQRLATTHRRDHRRRVRRAGCGGRAWRRSAPFTTDYSLDVVHPSRRRRAQQERRKARIGKVDAAAPALLELHSLRGDIRLLRRAVYVDVPVAPAAPSG